MANNYAQYYDMVANDATTYANSVAYLNNNFVAISSLAANVITLTANNSLYLGGLVASGYQTTAGLSANVATLTANNANNLGGVVASGYQTTAGLSANVAILTSNNTTNLGGLVASGYQTTAGLSANIATLSANNVTNLNARAASYYTNASNITTGTLPYSRLVANVVNTSANFTITGSYTFANSIAFSNTITANGSNGTAGFVLNSSGPSGNVYWDSLKDKVPYLSGNYYSANFSVTAGGTFKQFVTNTAGVAVAAGSDTPLYLMPFLAEGDAVIASLGFRTATPTGLNCLAKMAIWNNDSAYMRPTGTPIGYNDTAANVSAVDTNYSIALSGSPNFTYGNIYWLGLKATVPAGNVYSGFLCIRNSSTEYMNLIGHQPIDESENGFYPFANTGIQVEGLSINTVFTSDMSTTNITPSANIFYTVTGNSMPAFFFGVQ